MTAENGQRDAQDCSSGEREESPMDSAVNETIVPATCPAAEPSQEHPTSPALGRNGDGTFAPRNLAALKHGAYSRQVQAGALGEQAEARAVLAGREAAILTDLGGAEQVSVLATDAVARYVALQMVEDWLLANITSHGPLTPKGRQRAALSALLQVGDRLTKLAAMLGLERRPKPAQSLADVLAGRDAHV